MSTSLKKTDIIKTICEYAAVVIFGCVFVLVSASWISPIFKDAYGYDSSWYSMMGRAITMGMVPYRDYFDLKGPVFFFIEAIGQFFYHGRFGVFIIECIASSVSYVFIWKICKLYVKRWQAAIVLLITFFASIYMFWGGNTCEEYMMPFNYACMYFALKYLKDGEYEEYSTPAIIFGVSFGVFLLSKVTTCAPMGASALTVVIILIAKKKARLILPILAYFLLGFVMIFIPVCFYFIFNHAFEDFIYAAFVFAYRRGTNYYETFSYDWESKIIICYAGFVAALLIPVKKVEEHYIKILGLLLPFITWAALHLGTPYTYYFLLTIPTLVFTLIFIMIYWSGPGRKRIIIQRRVLWLILLILIFDHYYPDTRNKIRENIDLAKREEDAYVEECKNVLKYIPEEEWNDIYDLESGMIFYEVNQLLPANRYPINLPYFLHLNPEIKINVLNYLDIVRPQYVMSEEMEAFDDQDVKNYVFSHYMLMMDFGAEEVYLRVED